MAEIDNNYTMGRGELHFSKFKPGTKIPKGERYIGNTPEFSGNFESETYDHTDSDHGVNEEDFSITLRTTRQAQFTTDNVNPENLAFFFFGESSVMSIAGGTITDEVIAEVEPGLTYQLGMTEANPSGAKDVNAVAVKSDDGSTTYVLDTDYSVDLELGRVTILEDGAIADGDSLNVDYTEAAYNKERILSGANAIEGSLRYIAYNPAGKDLDWYMPWVKITPNGDFSLKGDEIQSLPFTVKILKKPGSEAIYIDGRPFQPA